MAAKVEKQRMVDVCLDKFLNSAPNAAPNTNQSEHQPPLSFDSFISFHLTSKLARVYVWCMCSRCSANCVGWGGAIGVQSCEGGEAKYNKLYNKHIWRAMAAAARPSTHNTPIHS